MPGVNTDFCVPRLKTTGAKNILIKNGEISVNTTSKNLGTEIATLMLPCVYTITSSEIGKNCPDLPVFFETLCVKFIEQGEYTFPLIPSRFTSDIKITAKLWGGPGDSSLTGGAGGYTIGDIIFPANLVGTSLKIRVGTIGEATAIYYSDIVELAAGGGGSGRGAGGGAGGGLAGQRGKDNIYTSGTGADGGFGDGVWGYECVPSLYWCSYGGGGFPSGKTDTVGYYGGLYGQADGGGGGAGYIAGTHVSTAETFSGNYSALSAEAIDDPNYDMVGGRADIPYATQRGLAVLLFSQISYTDILAYLTAA